MTVHFLAESVEIVLVETALQEGARIDAGRRVTLDIDHVAAVSVGAPPPEMIEADVVEGGGGGEAGDVAAELGALAVGPHDHGQGVPTDQRADAPFDRGVAG